MKKKEFDGLTQYTNGIIRWTYLHKGPVVERCGWFGYRLYFPKRRKMPQHIADAVLLSILAVFLLPVLFYVIHAWLRHLPPDQIGILVPQTSVTLFVLLLYLEREKYEISFAMRGNGITKGSLLTREGFRFQNTEKAVFAPTCVELSGKNKIIRILVETPGMPFVRAYILDRLPKSTKIINCGIDEENS